MRKLYRNIIDTILMASFGMFIGCRDDLNLNVDEEVVVGLPATINLKISVPEMSVRTREAGTSPDEANEVNNLWIGIFDETTKKKVNEITLRTPQELEAHKVGGTINLEVEALSGEVYIVGVANAKDKKYYLPKSNTENQGIDDGIAELVEDEGLLTKLQDESLTWDDYKNIAAALLNPTYVSRQGGSSFVMSGSYSKTGLTEHDRIVEATPITPGENNGYIHLQRLDAYNLIKITPGPNIKIEPISWKVVNVPALSFLQEMEGYENAADHYYDLPESFYEEGRKAYNESDEYGIQQFNITRGDNNIVESCSFDFYLCENKHQGRIKKDNFPDLPDAAKACYNYREREFKDRDTSTDENIKDNVTNTGWYQSLVETTGNTTPAIPTLKNEGDGDFDAWNNNATYIELRLTVEYSYNSEDDPGATTPVVEGSEGSYKRMADVTYIIHLGYCEDKDEEGNVTMGTVNDFSCFRNTQYEYNIKINVVNNVVVEARSSKADDDPQPGVEGLVTDMTENPPINLDSHYHVVNIQMSDDEREQMVWMIQTPYGNNQVLSILGGHTENISFTGVLIDGKKVKDDNQFYNWIQILPTSGENVIAEYPGDRRLKNRTDLPENYRNSIKDLSNGGVWYLNEFCDPNTYRHSDYKVGDPRDTKRWYTVFIDEYVYEYLYNPSADANNQFTLAGKLYDQNAANDPNGNYNWKNYVNIDNRKLWIIAGVFDDTGVSPDRESFYAQAKYFITQESIQSYYSSSRTVSGIGIESTNESLKTIEDPTSQNSVASVWGRADYANYGDYILETFSPTDGLYNMYLFANNKNWDNQYINLSNQFRTNNGTTYYIPDHKNNYMAACVSRNRDLNGNGKIDVNEIRWYLPTDATYTRIILGAPSLRSPLFNARDYQPNAIGAGNGTAYSHYAASNGRMTWAEELAATGGINPDWGVYPGNFRCVRNIGLPTTETPVLNPTEEGSYQPPQQAYKREGNIITLEYYKSTALRSFTSDAIGPHSIADYQAYGSRKFQIANTYCQVGVNLSNDYTSQAANLQVLVNNEVPFEYTADNTTALGNKRWTISLRNNSVCKFYHEDTSPEMKDLGTWRVPNITELGIMFLMDDVFPDNESKSYVSSSYEYFNTRRNYYMGVSQGLNNITANFGNARVRCVKDIEASY